MNNFIFIYIFLIFGYSPLFSAEFIHGTVYGIGEGNEKVPLKNARLYWLNSDRGTLTDDNGVFLLNAEKTDHYLIVSYVGYLNDTLHVHGGDVNLEIVLNRVIQTDAITVTGRSPDATISKSDMASNFTITERGLKKAACCNLAESFVTNAAADVEYSDAVTGARQIKLLGLQGIYSQLMFENMPTMRGLASSFGLAYIPGPWMQAISISKGTSSVVNGFESITGQINLDFKKPEDYNQPFFNVFAEEIGRFEANVDASYKLNDEVSTMMLLHANTSPYSHDYNKNGFTDHPLVNQLNFMNRWKADYGHFETVSGAHFILENRQSGQSDYLSGINRDAYGIDINTTRIQVFSKNGFLLDHDAISTIGSIVTFTHQSQKSTFGRRIYDAEQNSFNANLIFDHNFINEDSEEKIAKVTTGVSFQYDNLNENLDLSPNNRNETIPGVFTELSFAGIDNFVITAGFRADHHNKFGIFYTPRLHLKYDLFENTVLRASAGKGYRSSYIYAENTSILASSRNIIIEQDLRQEEAWNYGLNAMSEFDFWGIFFTLNIDFFHTNFINQVVMDMDRDSRAIYFSNLDGQSYSNSFQIDLIIEPFAGFTASTAFRINDVKSTYNGVLMDKPLQSITKRFLNLAYTMPGESWSFDFTFDYNGKGRLPSTQNNPEEYRLGEEFPGYLLLHAQITRRFGKFEIYVGGENLGDYIQPNPIIAYNDPFGNFFDTSMVWGPIMGRKIYMGARYTL